MKIRAILLVSLLTLAPAAALPQSAGLTTVRGLLEQTGPKGATTPAPGISVTLVNKQSRISSPAVISGKDGMYYIPNITLGDYTLKVWTGPRKALRFPISVSRKPVQDIAPVIVDAADATGAGRR